MARDEAKDGGNCCSGTVKLVGNSCGLGAFCCGCTLMWVIIGSMLIGLCVHQVSHDEFAVQYHNIKKTFDPEVLTEGRYVLDVGEMLYLFKRRFVTINFDSSNQVTCTSQNGLEIGLDMKMQYQFTEAEIVPVFTEFGTNDRAHDYLTQLAMDSFRDICSNYTAEDFFFQRGTIETNMHSHLDAEFRLADAHASLGFVQLLNIELPEDFEAAIRDMQITEQDAEKAEEEREQDLILARTRVQISIADATILKEQALAEADATLDSVAARVEEITSSFHEQSLAYANIMKSMGMDPETFINSYLTAKILRERDDTGTAPVVLVATSV